MHRVEGSTGAGRGRRGVARHGLAAAQAAKIATNACLSELAARPRRALPTDLAAAGDPAIAPAAPVLDPIWLDPLEKKYDGMTAYGMSKAANLYFARELAERWKGQVTVNALHPGMTKTTLIREAPLPIRIVFALFASSVEKGKETPVYLALAPEVEGVTGEFFIKKRSVPFPKGSEDVAARQRLWDLSARLVGL